MIIIYTISSTSPGLLKNKMAASLSFLSAKLSSLLNSTAFLFCQTNSSVRKEYLKTRKLKSRFSIKLTTSVNLRHL